MSILLPTPRTVHKLESRASAAAKRIEDLIQRTAMERGAAVAWGQFLDGPRAAEQYGIYGTTAAVRILASRDYTLANGLVRRALLGLPEVEPRDASESMYDLEDLSLTLKTAALLSASAPGEKWFTSREQVADRLLTQLIDDQGWGHTTTDPLPAVLPTAQVLAALSRERFFRAEERCLRVVLWLSERIVEDAQLPIHELSSALMALSSYKSPGSGHGPYEHAMGIGAQRLGQWATDRDSARIGETAAHHYSVTLSQRPRNHYMFFQPDLLAGTALLLVGPPATSRSYILSVGQEATRNVLRHDGYRNRDRRVATLDQLAALTFLQEFHRAAAGQPADLLPRPVAMVSVGAGRKLATAIVLLALAVLGTALGFDGDLSTWVRTASSVVAALAVGLLGSALWSWGGS